MQAVRHAGYKCTYNEISLFAGIFSVQPRRSYRTQAVVVEIIAREITFLGHGRGQHRDHHHSNKNHVHFQIDQGLDGEIIQFVFP